MFIIRRLRVNNDCDSCIYAKALILCLKKINLLNTQCDFEVYNLYVFRG